MLEETLEFSKRFRIPQAAVPGRHSRTSAAGWLRSEAVSLALPCDYPLSMLTRLHEPPATSMQEGTDLLHQHQHLPRFGTYALQMLGTHPDFQTSGIDCMFLLFRDGTLTQCFRRSKRSYSKRQNPRWGYARCSNSGWETKILERGRTDPGKSGPEKKTY